MTEVPVEFVVAVTRNGVIGRDGAMPWRLSTDLKRFKALTLGKPVIMGRKTFDSMGKPLPGRINIVVTRSPETAPEGTVAARSVEEALIIARAAATGSGAAAVSVIGGGEIFAQAMPEADRLLVTHIDGTIDGDTVFPEIDPSVFAIVSSEMVPAGERDSHATRFVVYERRR